MKVACPNCNTTYVIDKAKLPSSGKAYINCKKCGHRFQITQKAPSGKEKEKKNDSPPIEYFSPSDKTALIYCVEEQAQEEINRKVSDAGFITRLIRNQADIRHYFRLHTFDLVILYQQGPDPDTNLASILDYIHNMPTEIRRHCLVIYIYLGGNKYNLFDAFSRGVDVCVNPLDIAHFEKMVPMFIELKKGQYMALYECKRLVEESAAASPRRLS